MDQSYFKKSNFSCVDCQVSTRKLGHYYMVSNWLWRQAGAGRGMLCLSCLEQRIGRPLTTEDFPMHIPVNQKFFFEFGTLEAARAERNKAFDS